MLRPSCRKADTCEKAGWVTIKIKASYNKNMLYCVFDAWMDASYYQGLIAKEGGVPNIATVA